ncbi:MAG: M48 family metallopeptidase [Hyphomicrobiaceae bacterium]
MKRFLVRGGLAALLVASSISAQAQSPLPAAADDRGVKVGNPSFVRKLVPAESLENAALQQYGMLKQKARSKGALLGPEHPQNVRLRRIAQDLLPHAHKWNPRAKDWKWEVVLIRSGSINAFCMPGGKIAFFTGILDKLKLSDDEVAMVMGHEIAHALREHARERAAKNTLTNVGGRIIGSLIFGGGAGEVIGAAGGNLLTLRFSRGDELEADLIGMELAARAGYDPASGISLWEKMSAAATGAPPQWLSTHPASKTRVQLIKDNLKDVVGLYERAKAAKAAGAPMPAPFPGAQQPQLQLYGGRR